MEMILPGCSRGVPNPTGSAGSVNGVSAGVADADGAGVSVAGGVTDENTHGVGDLRTVSAALQPERMAAAQAAVKIMTMALRAACTLNIS